MNKLIYILFVLLAFEFFFPATTYALSNSRDLTITCENKSDPCLTTPSGQLPTFDETNILPGDTFKQTITVINNDQNYSCSLNLIHITKNESTPTDFSNKLFTVLRNGNTDLYGTYSGGEAMSDKSLSNLYSETPLNLNTVINPVSSVILDWYITFDKNTSNKIYQYAETKFDYDLTFECGTGESPASSGAPFQLGGPPPPPNVTGGLVAGISTIAKRLAGELLGISTEEVGEPETTLVPEVAGASCFDEYYRWWIPLVFQLVLSISFSYIAKKKEWSKKKLFFYILLLGIISQIIHELLGCNCATGIWCPRYIYFNSIIIILSFFLYWIIICKHTSNSLEDIPINN